MIWRATYAGIAVVSWVCLMAIVWTLVNHKKLRQHPAILIAVICLNEAILIQLTYFVSQSVTQMNILCYFNLPTLW